MTYQDYKCMKLGDYQSVGMFGSDIYAYEVLTGFGNVPEYIQITEEEFNTFEEWQHEKVTDLKKMFEIHNRPVLYSGYKK